jgi:2-oxoglutarate dehydrogenase E1 component
MSASLKDQYNTSHLYGGNAAYIEQLYEAYLADPKSVAPAWREYFRKLTKGSVHETAHGPIIAELRRAGTRKAAEPARSPVAADQKQAAVSRLIQVYSLRGHQIADLDPLGQWERHVPAVLKLDFLGLDEQDMDTEFFTGGLAGTTGQRMKLRDILALLKKIYCGKVGADFAHISRARERLWLRERFEQGMMVSGELTDEEKRFIFQRLSAAEGIERYLHTKYVGQKRFSLEGGETLIPMLDDLVQQAGAQGFQEIVIGMAHRGRINVLINCLGKAPETLFSEFEGVYDLDKLRGSGDVKYHMGFSADIRTPGGNVHLALAFNPSHLEIVNPVVEGSIRARQQRRGDTDGSTALPLLLHGDAAFAGQGVVMETLQMSQARGFANGGTVHIIINNQIGFTTSDPQVARSTPYCSDVAKMVEAPVFHVNGDDPEAAIFATRLALEYRQAFRKDVVIDLVCYRRHGHNEADEPAATQPTMYNAIRNHPSTRTLYGQRLVEAGLLTAAQVDEMADQYRDGMDAGQTQNPNALGMIGNKYTVDWSRYMEADLTDSVDTTLPKKTVRQLGRQITSVPEGFQVHPRVERILQDRRKMVAGQLHMDWGFAETMAYASLLNENFDVRLTGQDSGRGTFFHRHAVLHNQVDGSMHIPLEHIRSRDNAFTVTDSLLSEEAVMGFEYGYSTTTPDCLVIWEGQFGDFGNGAQVVIDQFISSGESKWGRLCGLVLFLPHGYEGQGPEHSSARLERFLQLCAEHNMSVCVPSTPAQMFHMLRRQMIRRVRKPLVVMTPKSLLRHRLSVSPLEELTRGSFQLVIPEDDPLEASRVKRVVFCSGKVYYDLLEARRGGNIEDVALVRLEQLYPFPSEEYAAVIASYPQARDIVWCQEEPQNQGAWYQIRHRLQEGLGGRHRLHYAGRAGAAAPASGIFQVHVRQQEALVNTALGVEDKEDLVNNKSEAVRKKA